MKTRLKRVLSLALTALMLLMLVPGAFASEIVTSEPVVPGLAVENAAEPEKSAADALYERLMACTTCDEFAAALEALTEEETALLDELTDEQNAALEAMLQELGWYDVTTLVNREYEIVPNGTQEVTVSNIPWSNNGFTASCSETGITATLNTSGWNVSGYTISVGANVPVGKYTLTIRYKTNNSYNYTEDTVTITVPATVPVHVYVSSTAPDGTSWRGNAEFQELIGLYVCDSNAKGYFPAGTIELNTDYFRNKNSTAVNTPGTGLINDSSDWERLYSLLSSMKNNNLSGNLGAAWADTGDLDFSRNNGNHVSEYLKQAYVSYGAGWGSNSTALFRWHLSFSATDAGQAHLGHPGDTTTKYHLDLCFNTNTITFICGNNGITSGEAKDGTTVDSRVYITGSKIQEPRNLYIPAGYQFMGYYADADFKTPWNGIGTPLNEDQTVYIKITPKNNVILYYKVAQGNGTVYPDSEGLNPVTGVAKGSTATPANDNWVFDGWYTDEDCTELLSKDATYAPTKEADAEWINGTTYYAKFVRATVDLTIKKTISGNMCNTSKSFAFTVTYTYNDVETTVPDFSLSNNAFSKISIPVGATVTVTETPESYKPTVSADDSISISETTSDSGRYSISFTMPSSNATVTFNNEKNAIPDMGVLLDSLPYILILAVVVAVGAFVFIRKRREHDDD